MILPKESATFSSCRFNFLGGSLIPNSRYKDKNDMDTGYDDQPFWGFRRIDGKDASQRQEKLVRAILAQCDNLNGEWEDDSYIVWGNTLNGDIRCDNIFSVAKKLGLL